MRAFPGLTTRNLDLMKQDRTTALLQARVRELREHARTVRLQVDAYVAEIFARYRFLVSPEFLRPGSAADQVITTEADLYLTNLDAPEVAAFYRERDAAHSAHGFTVQTGVCPALLAEGAAIDAENSLLNHAERYLGVAFRESTEALREQALTLLLASANCAGGRHG